MKIDVRFIIISVAVTVGIFLIARAAEYRADKKNGIQRNDSGRKVRRMVYIAMLSAVAVVLMTFKVPLPFLPPFYKVDASELPVMIGAFLLGPTAGVMIELVKVLLNLLVDGTTTAFIGEFANFLIGCAFVVPASVVYYHKKTKKSAAIGLFFGVSAGTVCGCLLNAFLLLPAYSQAFYMDMEALIAMGTKVNGAIDSLMTFVIFATAPLNLIKGIVVATLTLLIYKPVSRVLKGEHKDGR